MINLLKQGWKLIVLIAIILVVSALYFGKYQSGNEKDSRFIEPGTTGKPMVMDLGSTGCIPCQMMVPVLKELTTDYQGKIDIQFIDVNEQSGLAERFRIYAIPTQIIFNRQGKEVFRHQGFIAKIEIVNKLKQLGLD
jgi:thioredoxin 1